MARTSADGYVEYGIETSFGTEVAKNIALGIDEKIGRWTENNGQRVLKQLGSAEPKTHAYGTTKGQAGVEFILSNPWIFYPLLGSKTQQLIGDIHLYSITRSKRPVSMSVEIGQELEDASVVRSATGAIIDSITIGGRLDDDIKCSASIKYGNSSNGSVIDTTPATDDLAFPYEMTQAKLSIPNTSEVKELQSFNLSIQNGNKLRYKAFSKTSASAHGGLSVYGLTIDKSMMDSTFLDYMRIRKKDLTAKLLFTNGETGANQKSIEVALTGIGISEHGTGMQSVEPIEENLQLDATGCTITAASNVEHSF